MRGVETDAKPLRLAHVFENAGDLLEGVAEA